MKFKFWDCHVSSVRSIT